MLDDTPAALAERLAVVEAALTGQAAMGAALVARVSAFRELLLTAISWIDAMSPALAGQFEQELAKIEDTQ